MKGLAVAGSILLGIALIGFGIIQWATHNFLTSLLPFTVLPLKILWVNVTATLFILCGFLFVLCKPIAPAAAITGLLFTVFFLYPHLPRLLSNIRDPRVWTVAFETGAIASGAWMISAARINNLKNVETWMAPVQRTGGVSRIVFAACLAVFGTQHFMYGDFIVTLMPAWLPGKIVFSYLVRFGFLLAALSLLLNRKVNWSMFLLGSMFLTWVLILHGPRSVTKRSDANEWASLCIALALSGISFYHSAMAFGRTDEVVSQKKNNRADNEYIIAS